MHILVVDDDPILCKILTRFLTGEGFQVTTAGDGREALAYLERNRPSLILLDIFMPNMDGAEFVRELRERKMAIPFLVMTGADQAANWAEELGADSYIAKPVSLPLLLSRITHVLG